MNELSNHQKRVLQILPIPSALLSVAGSSLIISAAQRSRKKKKLTSYGRLLFFLSLYDIQSSITYAVASFLRPRDTSIGSWSFGNNATCTAVGFLNQVSFSNTFFVCMLSCYFLLAARFGYTNEQISKRVEPVMHVTAIGYPFVTSIISLSQGWYGEVANGLSCWIRMKFPKNCGDESEMICISDVVIWLFYVLPSFFALACLTINGIVMFQFLVHHRQRTRAGINARLTTVTQEGASSESVDEEKDEECVGEDDREPTSDLSPHKVEAALRIAKHNDRLKMLASQAFLYVLSFVLCNLATAVLVLLELNAKNDTEQAEVIPRYFALAIMQAMFHPLQGLLNMLIFVRPKFINYRNKYSNESRSTVARLALFGFDSSAEEHVKAPEAIVLKPKQSNTSKVMGTIDADGLISSGGPKSMEPENRLDPPSSSTIPLPRDMVSSLSGSTLDEYEAPLKADESDQTDTRPKGKNKSIPRQQERRKTGQYIRSLRASELEMISELSASVFESIVDVDDDDSVIEEPNQNNQTTECRWGSDSSRRVSDVSPRLTLKISLDSSCRTSEDDLDLSERRWGSSVGRRPSDVTPIKQSILRRASSASSHESAASESSDDGSDQKDAEDVIQVQTNPFQQLFRISADSASGEHGKSDVPQIPPRRKRSPLPCLMTFQGLQN